MKTNRPKILIIILLMCFVRIPLSYGKSGINYSRPTIYKFSGMENGIYTPDTPYSATTTGNILHLEFDQFPMLGFESYKITINESNTNTEKSFVEFRFIDLMYRFDFKSINLFAGFGVGDVKFNCKVSACESFSFTEDSATQFFGQIGIPVTKSIDIHISAHRVMGSNEVKFGNKTRRIELGGYLVAWGLLISW